MAPKKIRYQSRSVETHVDAPRDAVWERIVAVIRDEVQPAEELSFEPPWRFAYEVDTTHSALALLNLIFLHSRLFVFFLNTQ